MASGDIKKTILIVDDDDEIRDIVRAWLVKANYKVLISADGQEALKKTDFQKFDLIITDYKMPRMDGGTLIKEVRAEHRTKDVPIIVISSHLSEDSVASFKNVHYLHKPFKKVALLNLVDSVLRPKPKFSLDVNVVNIFADSTKNIMNSFGIEIKEVGQLARLDPQKGLIGDISSVVNLNSSSFHGKLCISFEENCYLAAISKMLMEDCTEIDEENQDGAAVLCDLIFGNARKDLSKYDIANAIPTIVTGHGHKISYRPGSIGMVIPHATEKGKFFIQVIAEPTK